jgi:zinc transport system ATP-binding protein
MALIDCEGLTLRYERTIAVQDLTFAVETGDYLCIVGENGSGKSTLIKALLRLHPVSEGALRYGDGLKPSQIGYLPQQTAVQRDFPASVREVVLSGCLNRMGLRPVYLAGEKKRALAAMERLGIAALAQRSYHQLSGGQQQRVLLARALCATQRLLLLDEPGAGLDPLATQELYRTIGELNQQDGITVVMVSHDVNAAVQNARHILHLRTETQFYGTAEAYRQSDVGRLYLGVNAHA